MEDEKLIQFDKEYKSLCRKYKIKHGVCILCDGRKIQTFLYGFTLWHELIGLVTVALSIFQISEKNEREKIKTGEVKNDTD